MSPPDPTGISKLPPPIPSRWRLGLEHVIGSWALRKQWVKYGNRPLPGKGWEMGISGSSVCAEPGGRGWLRRVSLFPTVLWDQCMQACWP